MTKEELQKENTKLDQFNEHYAKKDKDIRKEFARAFNWTKRNEYGGQTIEYRQPTWEEIFVELGKLLEKQNRIEYVFNKEKMDREIQELQLETNDLKGKINERNTK